MAKKNKSKNSSSVLSKINFNNRYFLAILALLFAGFGAYFVFASRAANNIVTNAPAPPAIYFSPTSQTLGINETFTVELRENSGTTGINALQANFSYPTNLLDYVPTTAEVTTDNPNGISFAGTAFSVAAEAKVNTSTGAVQIARGAGGGSSVTGDKLIAKLTFKSKTSGGSAGITFTTGTALVSVSSNTNILTGTNGLGNASYTIDTTGPTATVTAPANSATVELGSTQNITANATDAASSVTKVEFYIDGSRVSTDTSAPYSYSWNTSGVAEGSHSIYVIGYDTYNNVKTSPTISVNVKDTTAPSVSITSPTANANLSGTSNISATATDNSGGKGVAKVEFYVDGVLKSTDTSSPYTYSWDTTTASDASHALSAKAYDAAATPNSKTSASVSVNVDNSDRIAPTAPTNLRSTGNTYDSIAIAWNASTDNVGVTGYKVTRNGSQVYSGTALSFNDTGLTDGTSYNYTVVAFDAKGNTSSAASFTASTKTKKIGDLNNDNVVNVYDLSILLTNFNTTNPIGDLTSDGKVDVYDLSVLLTNWTF